MTERFAKWITTHPIIVLILAISSIGLFASGAQLLSFSNDYRLFFSEENPQLKAFEDLQNTYTKSNNVVIVIAPKNKDALTRETLKVIEELTAAAWQTPYSTRVDSITNFQHTYAEGDDLIVESLVTNAEELSDDELKSIREVVLNEPALLNKLISPQGHVTGINVAVYLPEHESHQATPEVMNFIRSFIDTAQKQHPEIDFYLTGIVALNNALQEHTEADLKTLIPATFIIVVLGLAILLKSTSGTIGIVLVVMFSVAAAMGLAGWSGIVLTPSSIGAPTIIATLAIADCVHILTSFLFAYRNNTSKQDALIESLRTNFNPILLTSLTTAIGLLSLNFSDAPPLRDLGNIAAIGVIAAFFLSVTLLPALMMIMPTKTRSSKQTDASMEFFANFVINQRNRLLWGMALLILALTAAIPENQINDEFHKFFGENTDIRQATSFTDKNLTGIYEIHYSLAADGPGGISNPEYLKILENFTNWYHEQANVIHVQSILSIMKRLNKNLHYDDPFWYRIPEQRELSAQYLLLYEMSLPYGLDLNDRINIDKSATRLTVTLNASSTKELLALKQRAQDWLRNNTPPPMQAEEGAGITLMFAHIGERNIQSMLVATVIALIFISLILVFALRSYKIGLISLIPNLVPLMMAFGIWGLTIGKIGFALSVVASMSLGIIVDDTVHFLSKYLHAKREKGMQPDAAIRYAFSTVGKALWVTSLVLISGFLVLSLSDFSFNSYTGALMAITIGCALIADLLFLPPLLMKIESMTSRNTHKQPEEL